MEQLPPTRPPEAWEPLLRLAKLARKPLDRFLQIEAASGIVLLLAAALAIAWANSPWASSYAALWHTELGVRLGEWHFTRTLEWFVNDVLMVVFFFLVGLEIRRELHHGELSEWRRALLPAAAALGGMLAPAAIYLLLTPEGPMRAGWGVPMATDIAFALGVLALLGKRVPPALRVLLLALAVIDDLGAIIVIALFYSAGISWVWLGVAGLGLFGILIQQWMGVRSRLAYVPPAFVVWLGVYAAGVHPTIAGVLIGLLTPVRAWLGPEALLTGVRAQLESLAGQANVDMASPEWHATLSRVALARREAVAPAESLIEGLHGWVAFGIMPIFALANSGIVLGAVSADGLTVSVAVGVGLVLGKPLGIVAVCGLLLLLRVVALPLGLTLRHLLVLGVVAGIGFTMAVFVAQLAFVDPTLLSAAKLGIIIASVGVGVVTLALGRVLLPLQAVPNGAKTADEAESSTEA